MRPLWCWVLLENRRNVCELMSMGLYELKNELISELRAGSSRIDGDFERISSPLGEWMMLPIYNEA